MKRLLFSVLLVGCAAPVGTSGAISAPKDSAPQCASICHDIGLALDSVVVMANNVGCVCAANPPPPGPGPAPAPNARSGAAAGGMAAIMLQRQQEQSSRNANR
ncbi:MAG: hypothetical protein H0T46_02670 [Deltaproteobacteria bacterium]|nr:hypothetical protein [Deltaproteobacteria bacterium]